MQYVRSNADDVTSEMTKTFDIYFDFEKLLIFFNSFDFDIGFDVQK